MRTATPLIFCIAGLDDIGADRRIAATLNLHRRVVRRSPRCDMSFCTARESRLHFDMTTIDYHGRKIRLDDDMLPLLQWALERPGRWVKIGPDIEAGTKSRSPPSSQPL